MLGRQVALWSAISLGLLAACSPVPILSEDAPSPCGQTTEFAFVGESTLLALRFRALERTLNVDQPLRRGHFWVTAGPVEIPVPGGMAPRRGRMVCVRWVDGVETGLVATMIEDDWVPPDDIQRIP